MCCSSLSPKCDLKAVLLSFPHLVPALLTGRGCVGLGGVPGNPPSSGGAGYGAGEREEEAATKNQEVVVVEVKSIMLWTKNAKFQAQLDTQPHGRKTWPHWRFLVLILVAHEYQPL